jgi:hypothetical protein
MKWGSSAAPIPPTAAAAHPTVESVSPIPETGCGCGVRVPTFTSASQAHKLTVTELDDIRVVVAAGSNNNRPNNGNSPHVQGEDKNSRALVVRETKSSTSTSTSNLHAPPFVISHNPEVRPPSPIYSSNNGEYCNNVNNTNEDDSSNYANKMNSHLPLSLECDYDVRPTELYKHIQAKNWDQVMELLETDKAIEASVWVVRKEPSGQLRCVTYRRSYKRARSFGLTSSCSSILTEANVLILPDISLQFFIVYA